MDLLSYYGWFAFGIASGAWLMAVGGWLFGHKRRSGLAVFSTVVLVLFGAALLANQLWGSVPKHRANCDRWRDRYEQAVTMVDLERARDRLREGRCSITES